MRKSSGYGLVTDVIPPAAESNARSFTSKSLKIAAAATAAAFFVRASATVGAGASTAPVTPAKLSIDVTARVDEGYDLQKVTTPSRYRNRK